MKEINIFVFILYTSIHHKEMLCNWKENSIFFNKKKYKFSSLTFPKKKKKFFTLLML